MTACRLVGAHGPSVDEQQHIDWVATCTSGGLRWSATRVLASLGWSGDTKDKQPFVGYRTQRKGQYTQLCTRFAIDLDTHFVLSTKSVRAKTKAAPAGGDDLEARSAQFSTLALYMLLSAYTTTRQSSHHRTMARSSLCILIARTTSLRFSASTVEPEIKSLCHESVDEDNFCSHLASVLAGLDKMEDHRVDTL
eukprot:6492336-Amphidinium_carterae.1